MLVRRLPSLVAAWLAAWLTVWAEPASAGPRADVQKRMAAAMESYDLLEYETARKLLLSALELAKDARFEDDPLVAQVHLSLGIVYYAGLQDKAAARREFIEAVSIDPKVALDPAYKTPDMSTLLETVRATTAPKDGAARAQRGGAALDCGAISGLHHTTVTRAQRGASQRITAMLGGDIQASKVSLFVRGVRMPQFQEIRMSRDGECGYAATIASGAMVGATISYYLAARDSAGRVVASSGSAAAPNSIELGDGAAPRRAAPVDQVEPVEPTARNERAGRDAADRRDPRDRGRGDLVDGADPDRDDPLAAAPRASGDGAAAVSRRADPDRRRRKFQVGLGAASGVAYVTGETEQQRNKVQCCIAPGLFTLTAEVGYATSPRLTLALAARIGFPIGANLDGHSPLGPAGFARLRYAFSAAPSGFFVTGQLGGGIIRNTVKLRDGATAGMDTDIVALGPLLGGAGVGYRAALGDAVALTFDISAIAGVPVVGELGTSKLNFGVQFDGAVGAAMRF